MKSKMKNKVIAFAMSLAMVFTMMPMMTGTVHAATQIMVDGIKYILNDDNTAAVASNHDPNITGIVTIPSTINADGVSYSVTSINEMGFDYCTGMTGIIIPSSVTSIGKYAFSRCSSLESIDIPSSVTSIGECAFSRCSSLESINIPSSVTSIGKEAFYGCSSLASIDIPSSVTSIGEGAFSFCSSLKNINFLGCEGQWSALTSGVSLGLADYVIIKTAAHTLTETPSKVATCTELGNSAYWTCSACGKYFSDAQGTTEIAENSWIISATGHSYGQPMYNWTKDGENWKCTATRVCGKDTSHKETETVTATGDIKIPATCEGVGITTYTATFTNTAFAAQNKDADDIPPTGHSYNVPTYSWEKDGNDWKCTATRVCGKDATHTETETVTATSDKKIPATCEVAGITTYTATFTNTAFAAQNKDADDIPPTGHKYGAWTNYDADQHQRVCEHDKTHVEKANHSWDAGKVTKAATEKQAGTKTFTCTVCKATKTKTIPKLKPSAPKVNGTPLAKMAAGKTSLTISWNKIQGAAGYDIFFAQCNHNGKKIVTKKVKTIKGNKTFKWTKSGLKKGTAYKFYVRANITKNGKKKYVSKTPIFHAYTGNGNKKYTNAKSIKVNKTKVTLKKGKTFKIKAKVKKVNKKKKLMPKSHEPALRYMTSNSKIASVNSGGKITAKGKGTCTVIAFAHNGVSKQVKVTVK